jgi:DNA repair protein RecN (Recombination protein N)
MLTTLRISGFAIVDAVEVRFGPGLNVLTGETGAGKSILVNALHLVLGGRMSADVLREGADEAVVEALFELSAAHPVFARLEAAGVPRPEGMVRPAHDERVVRQAHHESDQQTAQLLVRRVAARGGRGRAFVNGSLVTLSMLESALRGVVDISGQHEHVSLLDPGTHLSLLDAFAGLDAPGEGGGPSPLARYRERWTALAALVRERDGLAVDEGERARRADYLAFQLRELEAADPQPGEDERLEAERRVLASAARLREAARSAEGIAYGEEGSASERVGQAARVLADVTALDPRLEPTLGLLRSAAAELDEAGRALARYADGVGGDPERLFAVEERLELLRALARKHGGTLDAAIARRGEMASQLEAVSGGGERLLELDREIARRSDEALALARGLTRARKEAATRFSGAVGGELGALAMGRCQVSVELLPPESGVPAGGITLGAAGAERAEILLAPNPGEPPRPLARIASGGELSRILLGVKRTLARRDPVSTYVFDEVDSGIGGAVAEAMGRALADVARGRQVVCITHLPQVAAFGERHHRVEKRVAAGRTHSTVTLLEHEAERRQEVARMLAGQVVTASALEHATALIAAARGPEAPRGRGSRAAPARAAARRVSA